MEIGVSVPIVEIGDDFGALRDYIQAAEDLGYAHVRILDHVLGAVPEKHPEVPHFPYSHESYIHEPFTLMAYLAAVTEKIGLTTGILILPQRQTALVAKQAAEVDLLSGGRLRLGIGVGWNSVEYEALGVDFATRGSRCDEQIEVLRQLWTEDVIDFHGKYHDITHAGINPLPVQRPIPIWIGAGRSTSPTPPNAAIRRIGRLADGYFPMFAPDSGGQAILGRIREQAEAAGRDPSEVGFEGRITITADNNPEDWLTELKSWEEIGASHIAAGLRGATSPDAHIDAIRRLKEAMG